MKDEIHILNSLKSGDRDAFSIIYHRYYDKLYRYLYSFTKREDVSEDIVHDVFFQLWKRHKTIDVQKSLNAYLYRIALNLFINYRKLNRISLVEEIYTEVVIEVENDDDLMEKRKKLLKKLIEKLPKKRKEIFILCKIENYSYKEIAEILGISERTVEGQLRKAMISMRKDAVLLKIGKMIFIISL